MPSSTVTTSPIPTPNVGDVANRRAEPGGTGIHLRQSVPRAHRQHFTGSQPHGPRTKLSNGLYGTKTHRRRLAQPGSHFVWSRRPPAGRPRVAVNQTGTLTMEVTKVGETTFLAQVARSIEEARALKPGIIQLVDRVLKVYVPAVLAAAALAVLIWTLGSWAWSGEVDWARAIFAALAVLVLGYPCALGMATPLAMMHGGGAAAEQGILMRPGEPCQIFGDIDTAVLDKTGTLTAGTPTVVDLVPAGGAGEEELLTTAAAVEAASEHPLARAIADAADDKGLDYPDAEDFHAVTRASAAHREKGG
ncbi:MAG: HAD family hydrolase [Streptosporangiaceae bacterium]